LYWPAVTSRVPAIALQIGIAYAVDAIVSLLKEGTWRVGFGPLPIVLSANLFAWFTDVGAVVVIVVAVASRTLIRRGGRHVFNPSAAGLTFAGFLSLFWSAFAFGGVFHTLAMPPNIAEVILLLSLIPQTRFRIVLISLGAALGLQLCCPGHGVGLPGLLLAFALFATDPATVPRTPVGQLLFGAFVGSATLGFSNLLVYCGKADDLSKVFRFRSPMLSFHGSMRSGRRVWREDFRSWGRGGISLMWRFGCGSPCPTSLRRNRANS
jgi:hypothetical protein